MAAQTTGSVPVVQTVSTKWSFSKGEADDDFFLTIGGVRALNPTTRTPYGKIEKLLYGRSSEELVVRKGLYFIHT